MERKRRHSFLRRSGTRGFTLIEISIAIVVLAIGLVTLLGLQSSAIDRSIRDRNKQQAFLIARMVMAAIESEKDILDPKILTGTAYEVLNGLGSNPPQSEELEGSPLELQTELKIEEFIVPIPDPNTGVIEELMKRVTVTVGWDASDAVQLVYYVAEDQI